MTKVGWSDKVYLDDKGVLWCQQDIPKVVILAPTTGILD